MVDDSWVSVALGDDRHLSYHEALPVAVVQDRDGATWYLLGIVVQADPGREAPLVEIAGARTHEVDALPSTWSGRWALVGSDRLRTDAGSLLGCFYAREPGDGALWVSSSPGLVRDLIGTGEPSPPLVHEGGMDWYPPPASRFAGIRRLLPSQVLALDDGSHPVRHRPLVSRERREPCGDPLVHVEVSLRTALRNLAGTGRPLWLALTGGIDSRVVLSAMWREQLDFQTFTFDVQGMSRADRFLPPILAREAGVPHTFIERRGLEEERFRTFDEHTTLHTADRDRELFAWGQWAQLPAGVIVIRANLFALGALQYYTKLPERADGVDAVVEAVEHAYGFDVNHVGSRAHSEGIREWAEWVESHPEPQIDWRDRFYWEQRGPGWAGALEQGIDLMGVDSMQPMSCESIMAALLRIETSKRYGKRWEVDLAYRMAPFLTDHPLGLGGSLTTRLRRAGSGWLQHPNKWRFPVGRTRSFVARARARVPVM